MKEVSGAYISPFLETDELKMGLRARKVPEAFARFSTVPKCFRTWGPFLERPSNLTGPKSYFETKVSRKVGCILTSNEIHFVSLADNFTAQFSNLLKLLSRMKNITA